MGGFKRMLLEPRGPEDLEAAAQMLGGEADGHLIDALRQAIRLRIAR